MIWSKSVIVEEDNTQDDGTVEPKSERRIPKKDSSDIKKHKKDVLRIASELMLEKVEELPIAVGTDIHRFINLLEQEPFDQNSLKRYMLKNEDVVELLKRVFG